VIEASWALHFRKLKTPMLKSNEISFNHMIVISVVCLFYFCYCEKNLHTIGTELTVKTDPTCIQIINNMAQPINFFVVEINTAAQIEWAAGCGRTNINPGDSRDIAYSEILGYTTGCKLIVYWWYCLQNSTPGSVSNIIINTY
jgi:hypothetical protein